VLVCTDVAAMGLDVDNLNMCVSVDCLKLLGNLSSKPVELAERAYLLKL